MEKLSFISVPKKLWHLYHPIRRKLSSFEVWGMNMCYECLYHEINGEKKYEVNKGDNFHVEDGTYVYNKENIVYNEHSPKDGCIQGRMEL